MFEEKHRNKMFIQLWGRQTESVNINAWPKLVENALGIDVLSSCKVEKGGQMIFLFNWNNWDKEASMLDSDGLKMLWGSTSSPLLMLVISSLLSGRSWFRNTRRQNGDTYLCVFFSLKMVEYQIPDKVFRSWDENLTAKGRLWRQLRVGENLENGDLITGARYLG